MADSFFDRVQETTSTTGTGAIVVSGASAGGFRTFGSVYADGATVHYCYVDPVTSAWEVAQGVYSAAARSITRGTFEASSTGAFLNLAGSAGAYVFSNFSAAQLMALIPIFASGLPAGPGLAAADILATYSAAANNDVAYTAGQLAAFALKNIPSWTSSTRPSLILGQVALGYNTTVPQLELGVGGSGSTTWSAVGAGTGSTAQSLVAAAVSSSTATATLTTGGAAAGPSITLVNPTFATGRYGQAVSGGSGSTTVIMPNTGNISLYLWLYLSSGGTNSYQPFIWLTYGSSQFSFSCGDGFDLNTPAGSNHIIYPPYRDNTWRRLQMSLTGGNAVAYINGNNVATSAIPAQPPAGATIGINFDMSKLATGDLIDDLMLDSAGATAVPTAAATRISSTLLLCPLDGNGSGL